MACVHGLDALPLRSAEAFLAREDRVAAAPAEPDHADFVRAGDIADLVDEAFDDGTRDGLTVGDEPGAEGGADFGGRGGFFGDGLLFAIRKRGFDGLEEGRVEGVAGVDVWDVGRKARGGVFVGSA